MKTNILHILRSLHNDESGQDLIEYALVATMIAFASVVAMGTLATKINTAFASIGTKLATYAP
jgi:pilus assembly protein Flp/PilA